MGNNCPCLPHKLEEGEEDQKNMKQRRKYANKTGSDPPPRSRSSRQARLEEELLHQQALAMVLYQQQLRLEKSSSVRSPGSFPKQNLPRSASARPRQVNDPILQPQQLVNKKEVSQNVETNQFVLVHGGGFGAWCWYKLIALLEETGFVPNTVDLAGSGIDSTDPNSISSLECYTKPLTSFLEKLPDGMKIILVGHDVGGACISYAMEMFPQKIAKAVFLCGTMISNGHRAFDVFAPEVTTADDLLPKAQRFNYIKESSESPTSIEFNKDFLKDLFFNHSPAKDVALAAVSIRPVPFGPVMERVVLTPEHYGSIPRFYILTTDDQALTLAMQENLLKLNPPDQVFRLKASDHAPFFSKPQALFKMLVEIAQIDSKSKA